jgi:hypothetical protein
MKKLYVILSILVISLTLGVTAMAQGKKVKRPVQKNCCASCNKTAVTPEVKKFKLDSLDLRREMMNKRFDLQKENLQETPDNAKIAAIKADMDAIKAKIDALKTAAKIPGSASCCLDDCPLMDEGCGSCKDGKGCGCECKKCDCKDCRNGKGCAKAGNCAHCNKAADCGCAKGGKDCTCGPDCTCSNCNKAKKSTKPGCKNCNKNKGQ